MWKDRNVLVLNYYFFLIYSIGGTNFWFDVKGGPDRICGEAWILFWCSSRWTCNKWWGNPFMNWTFKLLGSLSDATNEELVMKFFRFITSFLFVFFHFFPVLVHTIKISVFLMLAWAGVSWNCAAYYSNYLPENKSNMFCIWSDRCVDAWLILLCCGVRYCMLVSKENMKFSVRRQDAVLLLHNHLTVCINRVYESKWSAAYFSFSLVSSLSPVNWYSA